MDPEDCNNVCLSLANSHDNIVELLKWDDITRIKNIRLALEQVQCDSMLILVKYTEDPILPRCISANIPLKTSMIPVDIDLHGYRTMFMAYDDSYKKLKIFFDPAIHGPDGILKINVNTNDNDDPDVGTLRRNVARRMQPKAILSRINNNVKVIGGIVGLLALTPLICFIFALYRHFMGYDSDVS